MKEKLSIWFSTRPMWQYYALFFIIIIAFAAGLKAPEAHADSVIASFTIGTNDVAMYSLSATNFYAYRASSSLLHVRPTTVSFTIDNKNHDFNFTLPVFYIAATSEANCAAGLGTINYNFPGHDLYNDLAATGYHDVSVPFTGIALATSTTNCIYISTANWGAFLGAGQTIKGSNPSSINFTLYADGSTDYTTRIISVEPDHIIVATGTVITLFSDIMSNPADWDETWFVRYKYLRKSSSAAAIADTNTLFTVIDSPINYDGQDTNSATTTFSLVGNYSYRVEIRKPSALSSISSFFGLTSLFDPGLLAHYDTVFTVDHQTAYDLVVGSTTNEIFNLDASTTVNFRQSCGSFFNFDIISCIGLLFIPTSADLLNDIQNLKTQLLFKAPWGYATRFLAIITDTSTSTIPSISAAVPISATESLTVNYDMGDIITGAGVVLNSAKTPEGMSVQDIAQPWIRLFLALTVITIIVHDLFKSRRPGMAHGQ